MFWEKTLGNANHPFKPCLFLLIFIFFWPSLLALKDKNNIPENKIMTREHAYKKTFRDLQQQEEVFTFEISHQCALSSSLQVAFGKIFNSFDGENIIFMNFEYILLLPYYNIFQASTLSNSIAYVNKKPGASILTRPNPLSVNFLQIPNSDKYISFEMGLLSTLDKNTLYVYEYSSNSFNTLSVDGSFFTSLGLLQSAITVDTVYLPSNGFPNDYIAAMVWVVK
jgi:hypothetical protein